MKLNRVVDFHEVPLALLETLYAPGDAVRNYPEDIEYRPDVHLRRHLILANRNSRTVFHFLASQAGEPVGMASLVCGPGGEGVIENAAILPEFRGRGLGTALFRQLVQQGWSMDLQRIMASVYGGEGSASLAICLGIGMRRTHRKIRCRRDDVSPDPLAPLPSWDRSYPPLLIYRCIHYLTIRAFAVGDLKREDLECIRTECPAKLTDVLLPLESETVADDWEPEERQILSIESN